MALVIVNSANLTEHKSYLPNNFVVFLEMEPWKES